jgi:hypothetical protein
MRAARFLSAAPGPGGGGVVLPAHCTPLHFGRREACSRNFLAPVITSPQNSSPSSLRFPDPDSVLGRDDEYRLRHRRGGARWMGFYFQRIVMLKCTRYGITRYGILCYAY